MNLTLKQLFKFGAVCTCACALSSSAADFLSDSFEAPEGSEGLAISEYKLYGPQLQYTNWLSEAGDASTIVTNDPTYASAPDGPITNGTEELILNLETEGNTLSRAVTNVLDIDSAPVYVDTLIQFTPSEDEPAIDTTDVKIALWVNAESNLVVKHEMYSDPDGGVYDYVPTNSVIAGPIDPDQWYRLTIMLTGDGFDTYSLICLDGTLITHPNGYDYANDASGGSYFVNIERGITDLNYISFQGTGLLDELVVTEDQPDIWDNATVAVMLTLSAIGDGTVTFEAAGSPVTEVESGTEVVMTASDWYTITSVESTEATFTAVPLDVPSQVVTSVLSADVDCTVVVSNAMLSGDYPLGGTTYDLSSVAAWALNYGVSQAAVMADPDAFEDDYLLNVDAGTDAELVITSIVVDSGAGTTTITVEAQNDGDAVDFEALNGEVTVYTTTDLGVAFVEVASYTVTDVHDTATVVITGVTDQFLKAKVEVLNP